MKKKLLSIFIIAIFLCGCTGTYTVIRPTFNIVDDLIISSWWISESIGGNVTVEYHTVWISESIGGNVTIT